MAKDYHFIGVVKGPVAYLGDFGCIVERMTITAGEMEEELENGESVDDYIEYYIEEYINEWDQKFCSAQVYTKEQWEFIQMMSKQF